MKYGGVGNNLKIFEGTVLVGEERWVIQMAAIVELFFAKQEFVSFKKLYGQLPISCLLCRPELGKLTSAMRLNHVQLNATYIISIQPLTYVIREESRWWLLFPTLPMALSMLMK